MRQRLVIFLTSSFLEIKFSDLILFVDNHFIFQLLSANELLSSAQVCIRLLLIIKTYARIIYLRTGELNSSSPNSCFLRLVVIIFAGK